MKRMSTGSTNKEYNRYGSRIKHVHRDEFGGEEHGCADVCRPVLRSCLHAYISFRCVHGASVVKRLRMEFYLVAKTGRFDLVKLF